VVYGFLLLDRVSKFVMLCTVGSVAEPGGQRGRGERGQERGAMREGGSARALFKFREENARGVIDGFSVCKRILGLF
jgi:hypothetical protein